ncbi:MAG: family 20 glycosylhydrolase [Bacteroidetes bacterium]|nr:family 20 glycosylhydrolase [Bacteroidota bacterium]
MFPIPVLKKSLTGEYNNSPELAESLLDFSIHTATLPGVIFQVDTQLAPEAYSLIITEKEIVIRSADPSGRFYALQTLRQIVQSSDSAGQISCMEIIDKPAFRERGVMIDVSRCRVPTMETFTKYIDLFAQLRFNQLQLYTEHTFAYSQHESVWKDFSPITADEVRKIDVMCRARAIELIPNQNSFGHLEPFLRLPEYRHLAEAPDGYDDPWGSSPTIGTSLYPGSPDTIAFLEGLYDELLPNFTSKILNVGCDETLDLGQGRSKALCDKTGTGRVYLNFVNTINELVKKRGFKTQFWGDVIENYPELIPDIPKDMQAVCWWYEGDGTFDKRTKPYADAGLDFQIWPGTSAWMNLTGRWKNAKDNISESIEAGKKYGAAGLLITDWGDHGHWNPYVLSILPLTAAGLGFWQGEIPSETETITAAADPKTGNISGEFSELLIELGSLYTKLPFKLHNTTPWKVVLIQHYVPAYRTDFLSHKEEMDNLDWDIYTNELLQLREKFSTCSDEQLLLDEILWCCDISLLGVAMCRSYAGSASWLPEELTQDDAKLFAVRLQTLADRFQEIWLQRSRPGGLHVSKGHMLELVAILTRVGTTPSP